MSLAAASKHVKVLEHAGLVTHRRLADRKAMVSVASGWHGHLAILIDHLEGREPRPFWSTHARLEADYEQRIAAANPEN